MLSHIKNESPSMVDIQHKLQTSRTAKACGKVVIPGFVGQYLRDHQYATPKGPVFATAVIAATMAVKKTSDVIPLCHPIAIEKCDVHIELKDDQTIELECIVSATDKTGVEMEALHGVSVAALTIYDMLKAMSKGMCIEEIKLMKKTGGKSGDYERNE